jgi:hypothetical protein
LLQKWIRTSQKFNPPSPDDLESVVTHLGTILNRKHGKLFSRPSSSLGLNGKGMVTFRQSLLANNPKHFGSSPIKVKFEIFFPIKQQQKYYFKT